MAIADAAGGINNAIQQMIAQRYAQQAAERQYKDHLRQQQFDNDMKVQQFQSNEELKHAQLDATAEARQGAEQDRQRNYALKLDDTIPGGAIPYSPETEGTITALKGLNAGTDADERPAVEAGPLLPGDTGAALPKRFIKTRSQKQTVDAQAAADKEADNKRQAERDAQTARYQNESLRIQGANAGASAQNRDLANQLKELQIQQQRDKFDRERADRGRTEDNAQQTTKTALELADRLENHPGFGVAYGNISSRFSGFDQDAIDAGSIRDQLVAALALPNLGALKGPMSDKDILFIKNISTRLGNPKISEDEAHRAIAEAKVFLSGKLGAHGGVQAPAMGTAPQAPAGWKYVPKPGGGWTAVEAK